MNKMYTRYMRRDAYFDVLLQVFHAVLNMSLSVTI